MKIVSYPFEPFALKTGQINVISTGSVLFYRRLIAMLREEDDEVKLVDDEGGIAEVAKSVLLLGDAGILPDLNDIFLKPVLKHVSEEISNDLMAKLIDETREIATAVLESSYEMDIPVDIMPITTVAMMLKLSGIRIMPTANQSIYAKIESVIRISRELSDKRLIVLTNVSHYLEREELSALVEQVEGTKLHLLFIEFSETANAEWYSDCCYSYVDSDMVDFRFQ